MKQPRAGLHLMPSGASRFKKLLSNLCLVVKGKAQNKVPPALLMAWKTRILVTYRCTSAANFAETSFYFQLADVSSNFLPLLPPESRLVLYLIRFGAAGPHLPRLNPSPSIVPASFHALNATYRTRSQKRL